MLIIVLVIVYERVGLVQPLIDRRFVLRNDCPFILLGCPFILLGCSFILLGDPLAGLWKEDLLPQLLLLFFFFLS